MAVVPKSVFAYESGMYIDRDNAYGFEAQINGCKVEKQFHCRSLDEEEHSL